MCVLRLERDQRGRCSNTPSGALAGILPRLPPTFHPACFCRVFIKARRGERAGNGDWTPGIGPLFRYKTEKAQLTPLSFCSRRPKCCFDQTATLCMKVRGWPPGIASSHDSVMRPWDSMTYDMVLRHCFRLGSICRLESGAVHEPGAIHH